MKYTAGKPTGGYHMDGTREIGNTCPHWHRTRAAAEICASKHGDNWIALKEDEVTKMP